MRILAIETSGRHGSVAALMGEAATSASCSRQIALHGDRANRAGARAGAAATCWRDVGWTPQSIELVAVAVGPGSFTGLRIGVTTAKTFAYAVGAEVIGVNTLAVLAAQAPPSAGAAVDDHRCPAAGIVRGEVRRDDARRQLPIDCETSIVAQDAWLARLQPGDRVTGPALAPARVAIAGRRRRGRRKNCGSRWRRPSAASPGKPIKPASATTSGNSLPHYYRPSAAEEKADK